MFVVVTEIFAVHFFPKGCVTRRPAVLRRGANINKWVEKILHKVNFCLWESAWHQGLKTSLSVYNADRIRPRRPPWPCLTGWPALGVNPGWKIGYLSIAYFYHLVHFLKSAVFLFSTDLKDNRTSHASLSMYNADRIRPRRPPWPCWPALGVNPGWKIGYLSIAYFYHLVHFLKSAVFLFSTDLKDNRTSHASLSMYNADRIRPRRPPWPCLRCCPALGVNSGWKISYFVSYLLVLPLCIYLSVINTSKFCTNYCTANICICENLQ